MLPGTRSILYSITRGNNFLDKEMKYKQWLNKVEQEKENRKKNNK